MSGFQGEQISYRCPLFALGFLLAACGAQLLAQTGGAVKVIKIDGKDVSASNAGVLANQTLYVAGQDGRNTDGSLPKDFKQEVGQSLRNVEGVLRAAGMDFGNAVWINICVTHAQDNCSLELRYGAHQRVAAPHNPSLVPAVSGREPRSKVNHLQIISMTLQDGEDLVVGNSLRRILNKAWKQSA